MPQTILNRLTAPRSEHPLELEGLRVLWWMHIATAGFLAVLFRMWNLGSIPGVNGDEAWYGMVTSQLLSGESSTWLTPTGNPLNPFYFGPMLFLHSLFGPSFTILRVTSVVSGLVALVANVALCRKLFGERTALISTMILAVLPINIAYSRFGWDTSQTLLATIFVLYASAALARCGFDIEKSEVITGRRKRRARFQDPQGRRTRFLLFSVVALGCSVLVHPTNIFLAPLVVVCALTAWQVELRRFFARPIVRRNLVGIVAGSVVVSTIATVIGSYLAEDTFRRLLSVDQMWDFGVGYARLFSGVTVYRYIAGTCLPAFSGDLSIFNGSIYDFLGQLLVILAGFCVGWWLWKARPKLELVLTGGYLLSVFGFYVVAGPEAIQPHFERYALCLIAPAVLLIARAGINVFESRRALGAVICAAACWLLLLSFFGNYFLAMEATGGQSHRAFRTGEVEPKFAAYELIKYAEEPAVDQSVVIYADEWWNHQPLAYLASKDESVTVRELRIDNAADSQTQAMVEHLQSEDGSAWIVVFSEGDSLRQTLDFLTTREIPATPMEQINDYAGRPVLILVKAGCGANFEPVKKPAGIALRTTL
ncbi:MAG: glycosyltransferase family 39 protein [Pirellulales bacterium]|nr:glycosyltransferase family 39 protein [Pirellulales bacterium]